MKRIQWLVVKMLIILMMLSMASLPLIIPKGNIIFLAIFEVIGWSIVFIDTCYEIHREG